MCPSVQTFLIRKEKTLSQTHRHSHTSINPIRNTILTPDYLMFTISHTQLSNINAVGPCKVGHVGRQGRVGGQDFDRQIPAEGIHVDVLRPGPNCNLWLVLQNCGWFHGIPGGDEFKVQAPPQDHCTSRVQILVKLICDIKQFHLIPHVVELEGSLILKWASGTYSY